MLESSQLSGGNQAYIEDLYEQYLADASVVSADWRQLFDALPKTSGQEIAHGPIREQFLQMAKHPRATAVTVSGDATQAHKQAQVTNYINAYREFGHRLAQTDPLGLAEPKRVPELDLAFHGLSDSDLTASFDADKLNGMGQVTLNDIVAGLNQTYCGYMALEYMHIADLEQRQWLRTKFEGLHGQPQLTADEKKHILQRLTASEGLERYLGTRYVGQKRFSVEGADTTIPMLDHIVRCAAADTVKEVVIAMAHRGRLNVLINVIGKPPTNLFEQFEGKHDESRSGDVKYHEGFSTDVKTPSGPIHMALAYNPSHLEIVAPVAEGSVRAKQQRHGANGEHEVLPVVLHGDAAFAGQGVVMETFNLSQVDGYRTGGTIHLVQNNQVGFTTDAFDARSTLYCTDIAKMIDAPVFHVNGDQPEAAVAVMQLAFEYRMKFKRDVVIELVCYRRHGHNEADEPMATQPTMYQIIKKLPTTRALYAKKLIADGVISQDQERKLSDEYRDKLDAGEAVVELADKVKYDYDVDWTPYLNADLWQEVDTGIDAAELKQLGERITDVPADMKLQPQVNKLMLDRKKMVSGEQALDWGCAETLAYASLLVNNHDVRISGQDCQRGTFAHRHAVLHDMNSEKTYMPLAYLKEQQASICILNSTLSEEAVMGYECGFATAAPNSLVIWEGQFGDFANGAQVIVDQFLSSGEQKWGRYCGLALFLPHGYEGQGPEHSSARLERYLQLCAQDNMTVCVPSTPAQTFHMIRRQILRTARKPLIVMTPKSLLRHKLAVSSLEDLSEGKFHTVIPEMDALKADKVKRVVMCSGKVYYDLLQARRDAKREDVAIIRVEQLYPFPLNEVTVELARYKKATSVAWCQEEPKNQGAWFRLNHRMTEALAKGQVLEYAGRKASASPAPGYMGTFLAEQKALVEKGLG